MNQEEKELLLRAASELDASAIQIGRPLPIEEVPGDEPDRVLQHYTQKARVLIELAQGLRRLAAKADKTQA